ncbi:hypothetical protein QUF74_14720 [Candidatus Halobeggiatoa sp. HSG11]|nr:hypothetical protein [Candidatus Halobeggiatoa sp. HSG11]
MKQSLIINKSIKYVKCLVFLLMFGYTAAYGATDCTAPAQTEIPQVQCEALVALYNSMSGANWTDNTDWNITNTPCSWDRVTCSGSNVTDLNLSTNQLNGSIPPEIGNLTSLTSLDLIGTQLSGSIPTEIGNLTSVALTLF